MTEPAPRPHFVDPPAPTPNDNNGAPTERRPLIARNGWTGSDDARSSDELWWSKPGFLASGVFLLVLLLVAMAILFWPQDDSVAPTGPVTPTSEGVPSPGTGPLTAAPGSSTWTLWYGIALPSIPGSPREITNDVPSGFARTPEGALIAGAHLLYRTYWGPNWKIVAERYVTGPGREAFITQASARKDHLDTAGTAQIAAFKYVSYSEGLAVFELVTGKGPYQSQVFTMSWQNGDWGVVLPPGGHLSPPAQLSSIAGYIQWTGVAR